MAGWQIHEMFEDFAYIHDFYVDELVNYICGNLHAWTPNKRYWEEQYNYCIKLKIVINWRKKKGLRPIAKKGQMICREDNLINFIEDSSHQNCCVTV